MSMIQPVPHSDQVRREDTALGPSGADLHVVSSLRGAATKPKVRNALVIVGIIFGLFMMQLMLSIMLADGSYQLSSLQAQQVQLNRTSQGLREELAARQSPQNLSQEAIKLGMTTSQAPLFLRLSDGSVHGSTDVPEGAKKLSETTTGLVSNAAIDALTPEPSAPLSLTRVETMNAEAAAAEATVAEATNPAVVDTSSDPAVTQEVPGEPTWIPVVTEVDLPEDKLPTPTTR